MALPDPAGRGRRVYADHGSVAPPHPAARAALESAPWADPRRLHAEGRAARAALDDARASLARDLGVRSDELVIASSVGQALRWGVAGVRAARRRVGSRVVAGTTEQAALLAVVDQTVPVDALGRIDAEAWAAAVAEPGTVLGCLQLANQEVGTVQHLPPTGDVPLLCDLSAAVPHLDVATLAAPAALLVAHPAVWGAPAGLALLAVRTGTRWWHPEPADELVPVPLVVAAADALAAVTAERAGEAERLRQLTGRLRERLAAVDDLVVHGDPDHRLPGLVAVSALYVDAEALVGHLDRAGLAVSSGSACTADTLEPSHVLVAMGVLTQGNLRITLGRWSTDDDVDRLAAAVPAAVEAVRRQAGVVGL